MLLLSDRNAVAKNFLLSHKDLKIEVKDLPAIAVEVLFWARRVATMDK